MAFFKKRRTEESRIARQDLLQEAIEAGRIARVALQYQEIVQEQLKRDLDEMDALEAKDLEKIPDE